MKKLLFVVTALLPALLYAQQETTYVEVRGEAPYETEVEKYQSKISITATEYYTYEEDKASLEDLEKTFFEVMEKNGFKPSQFKKSEDMLTDSQEKQAIYFFETLSEAEFTRFNQLKNTRGMAKYEAKTINKPIANMEVILASALKDARAKALMVAHAAGKELDDLIAVSDTYNTVQKETYYKSVKDNIYRIFVKFSLK